MELPSYLSEHQRTILTAVLDRLVPGAGALSLAGAVAETAGASPLQRRELLALLDAVEAAAQRHASPEDDCVFAGLNGAEQDAILRAQESATRTTFDRVVAAAYMAYYTHETVVTALNGKSWTPQPAGRSLEPFDPSVFERQRQRPPFWRGTAEVPNGNVQSIGEQA